MGQRPMPGSGERGDGVWTTLGGKSLESLRDQYRKDMFDDYVRFFNEHGIDRDLQLLVAALAERGVPMEVAPAEECRPADVQLHGCPGFYEELRVAGQLCMEAASRGVAWHDMVVAAPTLTPYRPHLQRAFTAEGVPFRTDLKSPLLRHPRAALYLHVARLLFHEAPRESWLALVTSPLLPLMPFWISPIRWRLSPPS